NFPISENHLSCPEVFFWHRCVAACLHLPACICRGGLFSARLTFPSFSRFCQRQFGPFNASVNAGMAAAIRLACFPLPSLFLLVTGVVIPILAELRHIAVIAGCKKYIFLVELLCKIIPNKG
ncbi:hypothetical protein, partial [Thalassospira marina]|uniref:hypothetical protein n=1 Tax=Thalassospira marina TaxID=2048283 RepID=UPI001C2C634F